VGNHHSQFIKLYIRDIKCTLGLGQTASFAGVGVMVISFPSDPNHLIFLSPAFYAPRDDAPTISTGALMATGEWKEISEKRHESLTLTSKDGRVISEPTIVEDDIDYCKILIHPGGKHYKREHRHTHVALPPPRHHNINVKPGSPLYTLVLHNKYNHASVDTLQEMVNDGHIKLPKSHPKTLAPYPGRCPVCEIMGAVHLSRGPCVDTTELPIGTRWQLDYTFWNIRSIRGFIATLSIVESTSRMKFVFNCRHKRPPIDIVRRFFSIMRRQGYPCIRMRVDEGGELAKSEEFMSCVASEPLEMDVETTGGDNSTANGMVESPHRPQKRVVRSLLVGAGLPDTFWCFAHEYGVFVSVNIKHSVTKRLPIQHFSGGSKALPPSKVLIFGCKVRIIKPKSSYRNKALEARTGGDPREVFNWSKLDKPWKIKNHDGVFLGYSSHENVAIIFKPKTKRIVRCRHFIADEFGCFLEDQEQPLTPVEYVLRHHPTVEADAAELIAQRPALEIKPSDLDFVDSPFDADKCKHFDIHLPPKGTDHGMLVEAHPFDGIPVIAGLHPTSPLRHTIPVKCSSDHYIVSIDSGEPITAENARELLRSLQLRKQTNTVSLVLHPVEKKNISNYEASRALHDGIKTLRHHHVVTRSTKPDLPKSIHAALKSSDGPDWRQALMDEFDKNQRVGLYSRPMPVESIPKHVKILPSIIACSIKDHGEDEWKLKSRHCANGSSQIKGLDFLHSYSPTASPASVRIQLAFAAHYRLILGLIDVANAYQNTLIPIERRVVVYTPPRFMDWYKWRYPEHKFELSPSNRYATQILRGIQGDKEIGRAWYLLLRTILRKFGFRQCKVEQALYLYKKDGDICIVNTSTDDLLCAYSRTEIFYALRDFMLKFVDVTSQEGNRLSYLNLRIVQSQFGISYDQTEHIQENILDFWFPPDTTERLKGHDTPWNLTDKKFEKDLAEVLPATDEELKELERKYGGSFARLLGQFMHVMVWSRPEIGNTVTRIARYTPVPNWVTFAVLKRVARFFWQHPHRPVMYPRRQDISLEGHHMLRAEFDAGKYLEHKITNFFAIFDDADHAADQRTRRSLTSIIAVLLGVLVDYKFEQQSCIALHSTEAETIATFTGAKKADYLYNIARFLEMEGAGRPIMIYQDSQPCIEICTSGATSNRVKHITIPVLWIYEKYLKKIIDLEHIPTALQPADPGTKATSAPVLFRAFDYAIGVRFYPPADSEHAELMDLDRFNASRSFTHRAKASNTAPSEEPTASPTRAPSDTPTNA
jgi:hypothetical protein